MIIMIFFFFTIFRFLHFVTTTGNSKDLPATPSISDYRRKIVTKIYLLSNFSQPETDTRPFKQTFDYLKPKINDIYSCFVLENTVLSFGELN